MPNNSFIENLKNDLPAGLVVFLVALPLCLGIASASGAGDLGFSLFSGIIAGVVGGIIVGFLSGSYIGASGPAAGLAIIVFTSVHDLGYSTFLVAVILAGFIQILLGFLKAGSIAYYFPNSVVKGMLASIGIILILKQIPHALGIDKDQEGDLTFFQSDGQNTLSEIANALDLFSPGAIIISVTCLLFIILWDRFSKAKGGLLKLVPGALLTVVLGSLINEIYMVYFPNLVISGNHLVSIPVFDSFDDIKTNLVFPDWSSIGNKSMWFTAVTIAIVASLATLMCLEATDKIDPKKRITPANRELKAQGVGNIISGLLGGLPITQVIVRSSANVDSGGMTKTSTIFHGFLLLISVLFAPLLLNKIPLSALSAILFVIGYKLAKVSIFKELYSRGKEQFIPFICTVITILFTDLLIGIGIGFLVAIYFILRRNVETDHIQISEETEGKHIHRIILSEEVSFLNKGGLQNALRHVKAGEEVIIDGSKAVNIPFDIFDLVKEFESTSGEKGITIFLKDFDRQKVG
ncbi:MAG: hypothetical protein CL840_22005 [Crocinitomicaceae bacterium]|nr:hypothetical protein [Crocinitomicaceae bacterium]